MTLVNNINFITATNRCKLRALNEFANAIDSSITRGVNLNHIQRPTPCNFPANLTNPARFRSRPIALNTIQRLSKNPRTRSLPGPACACEEIGRGDAVLEQCIGQRGGDRLLAHELGKSLRAIFVVERDVGHGRSHKV